MLHDTLQTFVNHAYADKSSTIILHPQRLIVYKNNIENNLHDALYDAYPITCKLLGPQLFARLAYDYRLAYPRSNSNINHHGEHFSAFIKTCEPVKKLDYLSELATFEWACRVASFATNYSSLPLPESEKLLALLSDKKNSSIKDAIRLKLNPTASLHNFLYPILDLMKFANDPNNTSSMTSGRTYVLICRRGWKTIIYDLEKSTYHFLKALAENQPLNKAIEIALATDPHFDSDDDIRHWLKKEVIVGYQSHIIVDTHPYD